MNKTQKNWRNYWKNYKPTDNDLKYRSVRRPRVRQIVIPTSITIILLTILFNFVRFELVQNSGKIKSINLSQEEQENSNKNGEIMHTSIERIFEIFTILSNNEADETTMNEYIAEINSLNLSVEYSDLKYLCMKKIENRQQYIKYLNQYNNSQTSDIYSKLQQLNDTYNEMDLHNEIMRAFDKAGVKYKIIDNKIRYSYKS